MPRIDKFIETIIKTKAERLTLTSDQQVTLSIGGQQRPVSAQVATAQQVTDFVSEIAPPEAEAALQAAGWHEFPYESPSGSMQVRVTRNNGVTQCQVSPDGQFASPPAAAPPPVASTLAAAPPAPPAPTPPAAAATPATPQAPAAATPPPAAPTAATPVVPAAAPGP